MHLRGSSDSGERWPHHRYFAFLALLSIGAAALLLSSASHRADPQRRHIAVPRDRSTPCQTDSLCQTSPRSAESVRKSHRKRRLRTKSHVSEMTTVPGGAGGTCEHDQTMQKVCARAGPLQNGDKWRIVMLDGDMRKSLVADSYEAALALRDDLKSHQKHIARSFEESLRGT